MLREEHKERLMRLDAFLRYVHYVDQHPAGQPERDFISKEDILNLRIELNTKECV